MRRRAECMHFLLLSEPAKAGEWLVSGAWRIVMSPNRAICQRSYFCQIRPCWRTEASSSLAWQQPAPLSAVITREGQRMRGEREKRRRMQLTGMFAFNLSTMSGHIYPPLKILLHSQLNAIKREMDGSDTKANDVGSWPFTDGEKEKEEKHRKCFSAQSFQLDAIPRLAAFYIS